MITLKINYYIILKIITKQRINITQNIFFVSNTIFTAPYKNDYA